MKQPLALAVALGFVVALVPVTPAGADVIRDDEWHLRYLKVAEANLKTRGEGITVAIVDGGVDRTHDDLRGAVLDPVFVVEQNTQSGTQSGTQGGTQSSAEAPPPSATASPFTVAAPPVTGVDEDGHGTALAGAIAGQGHGEDHSEGVIGVAPGARILPVVIGQTALPDPTGLRTVDADQLAAGIELAVRQRARVIVVGYSVAGSERLMQAIRDAQAEDAIVVAADGDQPSRAFEPYPAAYEGVLAAVPLTRAGDVRVQSTSGRRTGFGVPGFQIMTTNTGNRYRVDDGSASAGLLAGVVALLRSQYPDAKADEILRRLTITAVDAGAKGPDPEYGLGRVDLVPALTRNIPTPKPSASPTASPSASPSPSAEPVVALPRSRGRYGWLLALPLVAVIAVLALYAALGERRIRISPPDGIDSVRASS
jgi:subtilisin family serine protease